MGVPVVRTCTSLLAYAFQGVSEGDNGFEPGHVDKQSFTLGRIGGTISARPRVYPGPDVAWLETGRCLMRRWAWHLGYCNWIFDRFGSLEEITLNVGDP